MRVVVLSDTHAPRRWKSCPPSVATQLRGADLILESTAVPQKRVAVPLNGNFWL